MCARGSPPRDDAFRGTCHFSQRAECKILRALCLRRMFRLFLHSFFYISTGIRGRIVNEISLFLILLLLLLLLLPLLLLLLQQVDTADDDY